MPKVSPQYKTERREILVSAAEKVFLNKGYLRATMQDVMTEAKVSRGGLYLYFGNKAEIFEEILERQDARFRRDLGRIVNADVPIGPALLTLLTPSEVEDNDRRRVAMIVEYNFDHRDDPNRRDKILARFDQAIDLVSQVIQVGVERGEFHPVLPIPAIARFLVAAQDGWAVQVAVLGPDRYEPTDYSDTMEVVFRGCLGMDK